MQPALTLEIGPGRAASAARCELYACFSQALRPPRETAAGDCMLALEAALRQLPYGLPGAPLPGPVPRDALQRRYSGLFEAAAGSGRNVVSLHESDFVATPQRRIWEDLIRFYEHFGLQYDGRAVRLWPDHLLIELECLHYLSFLETGIAGDATPLQRAQRDFIDRHPAVWLPALAQRVARAPESEPYAALIALLQQFVAADRTWLELSLDRPG